MKIFVVFGQTGEYSDHMEWPVKAFVSEEEAKLFVENVTSEYYRLKQKYGGNKSKYSSWIYKMYDADDSNLLDPKMRTDYTGTSYRYFEMELDYTPDSYIPTPSYK
jgi:hypothetical protein